MFKSTSRSFGEILHHIDARGREASLQGSQSKAPARPFALIHVKRGPLRLVNAGAARTAIRYSPRRSQSPQRTSHGNSVISLTAVCRLTNSFGLFSQRRALGVSNSSVLSVISVVRPFLVCVPRRGRKKGRGPKTPPVTLHAARASI